MDLLLVEEEAPPAELAFLSLLFLLVVEQGSLRLGEM